jgi:hypothetical protein
MNEQQYYSSSSRKRISPDIEDTEYVMKVEWGKGLISQVNKTKIKCQLDVEFRVPSVTIKDDSMIR